MTLTQPTASTTRWLHKRDAVVAKLKAELKSNGIRTAAQRRKAGERGAVRGSKRPST
jgi:hypothetical protein